MKNWSGLSSRDTGDIEQGRRVQVDLLPSIKVLSSGNYTDPNVAHPISTFKSPLVVRESTIAGKPTVIGVYLIWVGAPPPSFCH